jgi:hypothetical protein
MNTDTKPPQDLQFVDSAFAELAKPSDRTPVSPARPHEPTLRGPFLVPGQTGLTLAPEDDASIEQEPPKRMNRATHVETVPAPVINERSVADRVTPTVGLQMKATLPPPSTYQWLASHPGVLGYAHRDSSGVEVARQALEASQTEKLSFLHHLAQGIGAELGLHTLREVHIFAEDSRTLSVTTEDGTSVEVRTKPLLNTYELARQLASRRKTDSPT